jgi:hypothetical protein
MEWLKFAENAGSALALRSRFRTLRAEHRSLLFRGVEQTKPALYTMPGRTSALFLTTDVPRRRRRNAKPLIPHKLNNAAEVEYRAGLRDPRWRLVQ